jgi:sugar transferase (PEP-CTERM system associated)
MFRVFDGQASLSTYRELFADALLCFAAIVLAAASTGIAPGVPALDVLAMPAVLGPALMFAVLMALMYSFLGLYRHHDLGIVSLVSRLPFAFLVGGCVTYVALKELTHSHHPAALIACSLLYVAAGLVIVRGGARLLRQAIGASRVLVVGTGVDARRVIEGLESTAGRRRYRVVGLYSTSHEHEAVVSGVRVFRRTLALDEIASRHRVTEIIVAEREQRGGRVPMDQLLACRIRGIRVVDLAAFYERTQAEVPVDSLKASWLVYGHGFVQGRVRRLVKRVFDIVTSATLLVLASPVIALAAIAIKLDSRGPVLYRQERVGLNGRRFMCLKFRSMRTDAEKDGVARWASRNDARVTRVGRYIRKARIDELPQLISVLRGDMSMVGPRPERPSFVAQLGAQIPYYGLRHTIKPGLTGWAQVRYSYGASLEDARRKHQFDLYYIKHNSLWLDLLVLIETVSVVLFGYGAQ